MDMRGQTSMEFLILIAGVILLAVIVGYYLYQSAQSVHQEVTKVQTDIFD